MTRMFTDRWEYLALARTLPELDVVHQSVFVLSLMDTGEH